MGKILKVLAAVLALLLLVVIVVVVTLDPNKYKPEVTSQVEKATGRVLTIDGDIGLQLFPSIGFSVDGVKLSNAVGFPVEPMIEVADVSVSVALLPLFSGQVEVHGVSLNGVAVRLQKRDGVSNLDDLAAQGTPAQHEDEVIVEAEPSDAVQPILPSGFYLGSVALTDVELISEDLDAQTKQTVTIEACNLGPVAADTVGELSCHIEASTPEISAAVDVSGSLSIVSATSVVEVRDLQIALLATGSSIPNGKMSALVKAQLSYLKQDKLLSLNPLGLSFDGQAMDGYFSLAHQDVPVIRFELASDLIDIDKLLPASQPASAENAKPAPSAPQEPATEPDLSGLNGVDLAGTVKVAQLNASNLSIQDLLLTLKIVDGKLSAAPVLAKLYGGDLALSAILDGTIYPAGYQLSTQVREVEALPLVKALADKELVSGKGSVSFRLKGVGLTPDAIKKGANGRGNFEFKDGAVNGINVPHLIRSTYATLTGKGDKATDAPQKTDFTALTGSFNLADGQVTNPDLLMMSPLLRLNGRGSAGLVTEQLDYRLLVALVASLEGQGGKGTDDLKDVEIPLHISGAMAAPDISLDLESAMGNKVRGDLQQKLDEKLDDNEKLKSLKDKLGDFL
ncbi:AsmA family protein [Corallincola spongiicola]|uniref:AsmA family protein n=1 Tax=Corallincola spongiicola TaxID=2520508 RepID=A0ABY1WSK6_9GAMM|nr:AsmA family protein [Corallincola spongiicola]TAA47682.1 AsmA family protein [Corallincola spongiicola]